MIIGLLGWQHRRLQLIILALTIQNHRTHSKEADKRKDRPQKKKRRRLRLPVMA
jgi:hypothetical protein